jgi:hypothetical protein
MDVNIVKMNGESVTEPDEMTGAIPFIEWEHHEIHEGDHFFYTDAVTLGSAATQSYVLITPNHPKRLHITFSMTGSAITQCELGEGGDRTPTTLQTVYNSDRDSSNGSLAKLYKDYTGGATSGTVIWKMKSGAAAGASRSPMTAERSAEIILKTNCQYVFTFTSGTADNLVNIQLNWYSHSST